MKALTVILVWFAAILSAHGQGPRMTVAGTQTILEIEEASVKVQVTGSVVSTEMELMFRNPTARMVEGEFVLPLPAGATVSSYALEVNGALREAVAVEKERARVAYESIKRQMIDPGIVECEAGNVYRTRVFPVPASGTKRLRIGYVETLRQEAGGFRYRVPLKFEGLLNEFRCEIGGAGSGELVLNGEVPVAFATDPASGKRSCVAKVVRLAGELELKLPLPAGPELVVEGGKTPVFLLSDVFPPMPEVKRPALRSVLLFWDASESGAGRDQGPTFRLLDAWFREQGEVKVVLKWLRDGIGEGGTHEVRGGDWSAVRRLLETVDYDGGTSLDGLAVGAKEADAAIYCGDGVATLGRTTGLIERPLLVLKRGAGELAASLREWMERSGGIEVEVDRMETAAALRKMLVLPFRVVEVSGEAVKDFQVETGELRPGQALRVSGSLNGEGASKVEIAFGVGTEVKLRRKVAYWEVRQETGVLRRLWAQRRLLDMERAPERDAGKITAHCIEHGLVSDETSLIVLERFEDHVRYEIPPPEADLRVRYDEALAAKRRGSSGNLTSVWRSRLNWYERSFPDRDYVLRPRLKQVAIWKRAMEKVFKPEELDAAAFGKVAGWQDRVLALVERRRTLPDAKAYEAWKKEVEALEDEGPQLAATPVAPPPPGKPLVVSVRGLVVEPGQMRSEVPLTLREAVAKAGGRLLGGDLGQVALYRNAGKTVYSTASKHFMDIDLRPGDLLVVEDDWYDSEGVDPFSAEVAADPADGPAVIRSEDVWIGEDGSAGGSADGGQERRAAAGAIRVVDPAEAGMPDLAGIEAALKAGGDPLKAYLEMKGGQLRPLRFYVEVARRLFAAGQDALAMRVLSTLAERGEGSGASRRALAFWLMEFGKPAEADEVLRSIAPEKGGCPVSFARAELEKDPESAAGLFREGMNWLYSGSFEEIALTEMNRRIKVEVGSFGRQGWDALGGHLGDLSSDLRITVLSQFPDEVPDVEIVDSTGHPLRFDGVSPTGGRLTVGEGVAEYMIRRAVPGTYAVRISCKTDTTFRIAVHSNWGREKQKTLRMTRLVDAVGKETVAEVEFEFAAGE
jgi:hypothetical protein